jgi:hypothetical protein
MSVVRALRILGVSGFVMMAAACGTPPVVTPGAGSSSATSFRIMQRCPPGMFVNPSYDPRQVVEGNNVSFRLRGEATWRPGCVSAPYIVEENATSFRRIGSATWERK